MRTLTFVLCLFICVSSAFAAADLAPVLDSKTIAVARVDLNQVDVPKIMDFLNGELKDIVPQLVTDKAKAGEILLAGQGGLTVAAATVQPIVKAAREKGKADEIFFILDKDAADERMYPFFVVIPADDEKPKAEVDALRKLLLQNQCPITFQRHGFVFGIPTLPSFAEKEEIMEYVKTRFAKPSSEKRPEFAEALNVSSGPMLQIVVGNASVFDEEMENQPEIPPQVYEKYPEAKAAMEIGQKTQNLLWKKMDYFRAALDINKPEFKATVQMKDEASAKELQGYQEESIKQYQAMTKRFKEEAGPVESGMLSVFSLLMNAPAPKLSGRELTATLDSKSYAKLKKELIQTVRNAAPLLFDPMPPKSRM